MTARPEFAVFSHASNTGQNQFGRNGNLSAGFHKLGVLIFREINRWQATNWQRYSSRRTRFGIVKAVPMGDMMSIGSRP